MAVVCAVAAGCAGPTETTTPAETTKYTLENTDRFIAIGAAGHLVSCTGLMELPSAEGHLQIVANLKNRDGQRLNIQASCAFKGADGIATIEETPWQSVTLAENETVAVRFSATSAAARKYTIVVRDAR